MKKFAPDELRVFLETIDGLLEAPLEATLLGGGSLALAYGVVQTTKDLDIWTQQPTRLEDAAREARRLSRLLVPVDPAAIAQVPRDSEDRTHRILPALMHLEIVVLERHDVTLSKLVAGRERDYVAIEELHRIHTLDREVLVDRYCAELRWILVGDPRRVDQNVLECVDMLFGGRAAAAVRQRLDADRRRY